MRSSAAKPKAEPAKEKPLTISDILETHLKLTLRIAFLESILDMCYENFSGHDGLEPKSLVLTQDGRRVPNDLVDSILSEINKNMLEPSQNELKKLNSIKVQK